MYVAIIGGGNCYEILCPKPQGSPSDLRPAPPKGALRWHPSVSHTASQRAHEGDAMAHPHPQASCGLVSVVPTVRQRRTAELGGPTRLLRASSAKPSGMGPSRRVTCADGSA